MRFMLNIANKKTVMEFCGAVRIDFSGCEKPLYEQLSLNLKSSVAPSFHETCTKIAWTNRESKPQQE